MLVYDQTSRYYNVDYEYDLPQSNMLKTNYVYDTVTVMAKESGRLDLVSFRVYNTPVYWWLIARFNGIINPETAVAGTRLKIPKLQEIQ
jgi:nucleoid-associated protein YgaU